MLAISTRTAAFRHAALPAYFLLLGVVYASWAARIPSIKENLSLNAAQLGIVLLGAGIGAVTSFPLAAWLVRVKGGRQASWLTGIALLASLIALPAAPSYLLLIAAAFAYGASSSCFDVAVNAVGAEMEKAAGRSIMSRLHAWFCVGTLSGALFGSALAGVGISPEAHFGAVALLLFLPLLAGYLALPDDRDVAGEHKHALAIPRGPAVALGLICFFAAVAEGSIADWSGVFMKEELQVSDGVAPLAFAAFAGMELLARLVCDRLKDRFGARRVVAAGTALAAAGLFLAATAVNVPLTLAGFAITGAGIAALFPFVYSAAARHGSNALAAVATVGYSGNLLGPPVIGAVAHGAGMQAALAVIGTVCVVIAAASFKTRSLQ